jgi:hypothetical protein
MNGESKRIGDTVIRRMAQRLVSIPLRIHRDESGAMGIVSLFTLIVLVARLGMVMNSARQVDRKVKMQNAADAATYAGGLVIARNMNTLAFTNHLLCDVFALTAYMREARDRNAESLTPEIMDNWDRVAPAFAGAEFPKFAELSPALAEKAVYDRQMVLTWSEWSSAASELMLPVLEQILAEEQIPNFQRALVHTTPQLAQYATDEAARRHGQAWPKEAELRGVLWRTNGDPVGGISEEDRRTLPVVDPVLDMIPNLDLYAEIAERERHQLSHTYLNHWNNDTMQVFDELGKLSQFSNLWRIFTCGQLEKLLDEYPDSNLPFQIRHRVSVLPGRPDMVVQFRIDEVNPHMERDFTFVGVVYGEPLDEASPGVFRNPSVGDELAYAEVMVFVPRRRLIKVYPNRPNPGEGTPESYGGVPGQTGFLPSRPPAGGTSASPPTPTDDDTENQTDEPEWFIARQSARHFPDGIGQWHLLNQNWIVQLSPATTERLPRILSSTPYVNGTGDVEPPDLNVLTEEDIPWLSHH